jgi:carbonic anhydrase/acetyltransferase-like protein (isoleucine patch superfamily)
MAIYRLGAAAPAVDPGAWIAPGAHVIGQVTIAAQCGIWFGAAGCHRSALSQRRPTERPLLVAATTDR